MVEIAAGASADLHMVFVDEPCGSVQLLSIRFHDTDLISVRDSEELLIVRIDEADAASGSLHVLFQPVSAVAVAVQAVLALVGIETHEIGILRSVYPDAPFPIIPKVGLRSAVTELPQRVPAFQDCAYKGRVFPALRMLQPFDLCFMQLAESVQHGRCDERRVLFLCVGMTLQIVRIGDAVALDAGFQRPDLLQRSIVKAKHISILDDAVVLVHIHGAEAESVDDLIDLGFELRRIQVAPVVVPIGEELFAAAQVCPEVADAPGLTGDLAALGIGVFPFLGRQNLY